MTIGAKGYQIIDFAACLYRMALAAVLDIKYVDPRPRAPTIPIWRISSAERRRFHEFQRKFERALLHGVAVARLSVVMPHNYSFRPTRAPATNVRFQCAAATGGRQNARRADVGVISPQWPLPPLAVIGKSKFAWP